MRKLSISLSFTILAVLVVGMVASAAFVPIDPEVWWEIPNQEKFTSEVESGGETILSIAGFFVRPNLDLLVDWTNTESVWFEEALAILFPERRVLAIFVKPYGNQLFYPDEITFTQGGNQYNGETLGFYVGSNAELLELYEHVELNEFLESVEQGVNLIDLGVEVEPEAIFKEPKLEKGTVAKGLVILPRKIQTIKDVKFWYGDSALTEFNVDL